MGRRFLLLIQQGRRSGIERVAPLLYVDHDGCWIVVASNANMGGPTTAAAMAVARRWDTLVTPAILCGTLGYAVATFIGTAVGNWLG